MRERDSAASQVTAAADCAGCLIDGFCIPAGTQEPGNPCRACEPTHTAADYSPAVGNACGSAAASPCSQPDTCDSTGTCNPNHLQAGAACGSSSTDVCNGGDACDGQGICAPRAAADGLPCDDGQLCTLGDHCEAGVCVGGSPAVCVGDTPMCDPATGSCVCEEGSRRCVRDARANEVQRCSGGQWIHAETCAIFSQEFCNETTSQCDCIDDDDPDTTLLPRDPTYGCGFIRDLPQDPTGAWISFGGGTLAFDRETGLAWFNADIFADNAAYVNFDSYTPPGPATLNKLIDYCGGLNVYGLTGWRVPTIDEVKLLTAGCAHLGSGPCQLSDPACLSSSCNCDANLCPIDGGPDDYRLYCRPNTHGDCGGMYTTSLCPDCPAPNVMWSFWSLYGTYRVVDPNSAAANYCVREVAF